MNQNKLNKKIFHLSLALMSFVGLRAQLTPFTCGVVSSASTPVIASAGICNGCYDFSKYIPKPTDSVVYIRLNVWYTMPSANGGVFSNVTINDAIILTNLINANFDSLYAPRLKKYPTPQYIKRSKIHFVLNQYQKIVDTAYYGNTPFATPSANAFNVIFVTHPIVNGYGYASLNSNIAHIVHAQNNPPGSYPGPCCGEDGLVSHELAHCLGLNHTNLTVTNPFNSTNDSCFTTDYVIEGPNIIGSLNCNQADTLHSNNIISQNSFDCTKYLSPNQLVVARYYLRNNPILNNCIINQSTFNSQIAPSNLCANLATPIDTLITLNQIWNGTNLNLKGNVVVKSGNSLTINCDQYFKAGTKIIVEPGALLTISAGVILKSACPQQWDGIEVWGDNTLSQTPTNQGMVVLNNCYIENAKTGISLGKRMPNNQFGINSGGGIVNSTSSTFNYNYIDVEFAPYVQRRRNYVDNSVMGFAALNNVSWFKKSTFLTDSTKSGLLKFGGVILNDVYGIRFEGCNFSSSVNVGFAIQSLNSSFIVKKSGFVSCTFSGFTNAIYAISSSYNSPIAIDSAQFSSSLNNSIFLTNVLNPRITNNNFNIAGFFATPTTGLYLNNCTGYIVENNVFYGISNTNSVGSYIRNSGPYANSVYNNQFNNLQQGLWAVGQNYDPTNTNPGLTINCNDFISCQYDIGVYKSGKTPLNFINNTGIAPTQGQASTPFETDNVRNTYNVVGCNTNAENKYNLNTGNAFVITSHGSFLGGQFHPTPQTMASCSNSIELIDVVGNPTTTPRSVYCAINVLPSLSRAVLNQNISNLTDSINNLENQQTILIDGGNTQTLLNAINSNMSNGNLKNLLESKSPYLSNTVLTAYFNKNSTPNGHIKDIHNLNKPVSQAVWQVILNLNLPNGIQNQLNAQQNQNYLSQKNTLIASTQLYSTKLGLAYNEKLRRLSTDTAAGTIDSLIAIYDAAVVANNNVFKANALTSIERYDEAKTILTDVLSKNAFYDDYVFVQRLIIELSQHPKYIEALEKDNTLKQTVIDIRNNGNYLAEGIASALLQKVWGIMQLDEEKPVPTIFNSGSRLINTTNADNSVQLSNNVVVYPNPANEILNIKLMAELTEAIVINIVDITGKVVAKQTCTSNCSVNIQHLEGGVYFVTLVTQNTTISTKKIVVIK